MPWWYYLAGGIAGLAAVLVLLFLMEIYFIFRVRLFTKRLLTDTYKDNLYGMFHSVQRVGVENIIEMSLRAQQGKVLKRPMGSSRKLPDFSGLAFDQPNLAVPLVPADVAVDMKVTIGPQAKRPLELDIPILISGMGYGVGVSFETKIAWAKAATLLGTATNSGEGPYLPEERRHAGKYIVQYGREGWMPDEAIREADMVEIQIGQGVTGSAGNLTSEKILRGRVGRMFGLDRAKRLSPIPIWSGGANPSPCGNWSKKSGRSTVTCRLGLNWGLAPSPWSGIWTWWSRQVWILLRLMG